MLVPKKTKFRKAHKGRIHGNAKAGVSLAFGLTVLTMAYAAQPAKEPAEPPLGIFYLPRL